MSQLRSVILVDFLGLICSPRINTLKARQNSRHLAVIFKCIFRNENINILISLSLKYVIGIYLLKFMTGLMCLLPFPLYKICSQKHTIHIPDMEDQLWDAPTFSALTDKLWGASCEWMSEWEQLMVVSAFSAVTGKLWVASCQYFGEKLPHLPGPEYWWQLLNDMFPAL